MKQIGAASLHRYCRSSLLSIFITLATPLAVNAQSYFVANLDTYGGNSGSPVLDARGKLVGLAFDGNWESVSSNWVFDPAMSRMISVDQRYMRWIMQEVYPAPQLLKELGVAPKG